MAAGGIATGEGMLAAMALGADGVQIGTLFALAEESSAHEAFKLHCLALDEGDTKLLLKKLSPTRLAAGAFRTAVEEAEAAGADAETMSRLLGKGRAKKGIFEGDLEEGELEIGQASALLSDIRPVAEIMDDLIRGYRRAADKSYKL